MHFCVLFLVVLNFLLCFQRMFLEGGSSHFQASDDGEHPSSPSLSVLSSTPKPMRTITVSAVNKVVQLPENKVKLSAYTVPLEKTGKKFSMALRCF